MKWLLSRFTEPSSYAGLSAAATTAYTAASGQMPWQAAIPAFIAGLVAFLKPDAKAGA